MPGITTWPVMSITRSASCGRSDVGPTASITLPRAKATSVTLFLNRLLGLALRRQHELLTAFKFLLEIAVRRARAWPSSSIAMLLSSLQLYWTWRSASGGLER